MPDHNNNNRNNNKPMVNDQINKTIEHKDIPLEKSKNAKTEI